MNRNRIGMSGLLLASLIAMAGCDNNSNNNGNNDGGGSGPICTANAKECLDDHHARICSKEGAEWYTITCDTGETCTGGDCVADVVDPPGVVVCFPGDGKCMPGTPDKSLLCRSDGTGYTATDCPAGTACVGSGVCVGVCAVGSSICLDGKTLATCTNGTGYTTSTCGATEACVTTGDTPFDTAACKASECQPALDGCDFVCGNKTDAAADQTKFFSFCSETSTGYKWIAVGCGANEVCDAQGGNACAGGAKFEAACAAECTDGDSMCDDSGARIVCMGGKWGAPMACALDKVCFALAETPNQAVCGDPLCRDHKGQCDEAGGIRLCDATGNVAATATACATGACYWTTTVGGRPAGECTAVCKDGESECAGDPGVSITIRQCEGGRWTKLVNCESGLCFTKTVDGRKSALCGACAPGTARCDEPTGDERAKIAICDASGQWGTFADCTLGACTGPEGAASCVAQCFPGNKVCVGNTLDLEPFDGPNYGGYVATDAETVCDANGLLTADPTDCDAGKSCRYNVGGTVLGCVECVYDNEVGLIDSRCADDTSLQFCTPANTWGDATACGANQFCDTPYNAIFADDATVYAIPAPADRVYCHACRVDAGDGTQILAECRESQLAAMGTSCADIYFDDISGVPCPGRFVATSTVGDCCEYACVADDDPFGLQQPPLPASCVED